MDIDTLVAEIAAEARRRFDGGDFEGTPENYRRLATTLGISAHDDLKWQFVIDPEADDKLDPENPDDEAMIDFLSDDETVAAFLATLLERYRSGGDRAPEAAAGRRARPDHSEAFVRVRDLLLSLGDADRVTVTRLFGTTDAPEPGPTAGSIALLRAIATLDDADALKFARWCRTYVTRSGQVPKAPGGRAKPA